MSVSRRLKINDNFCRAKKKLSVILARLHKAEALNFKIIPKNQQLTPRFFKLCMSYLQCSKFIFYISPN
jgi:hypothetical protein